MLRKFRSSLPTTAILLAPLASLVPASAPAKSPAPVVTTDSAAFPQAKAPIPIEAGDPQLGRRDALLTLVIFADYNALPYRFMSIDNIIATLRTRYGNDLRVVFKDLPQPMFQDAALRGAAVRGVYALGGEPAFSKFVQHVGRFPGVIDEDALAGFALVSGIADKARFVAGLHDGKWLAEVQNDAALATTLNLHSVPIFYLNGLRYDGMQQADALSAGFDRELAACRDEVGRGMAARDVYGLRARKNFGQFLLESQRARATAETPATPPARPTSPIPNAPPELRPGKGIGPFYLGQSLKAVDAMNLRHSPIDSAGWIRVATDAGSNIATYQLRFVGEAITIIEYKVSPGRLGLRVGADVIKPDPTTVEKALSRAMGCSPIEYMEGGAEARCPSAADGGKTVLRRNQEYDCSNWTYITPARDCTSADKPYSVTTARVSKD